MTPRRLCLLISLASAAGCASPATAPNSTALSGEYLIEGTRVLSSGVGAQREFTIMIVSATPERVILDFVAGDNTRALPARDTATASGTGYYVQWNGNAQFNYSLTFRVESCQGNDVSGGGETVAWTTCSIRGTSD